MKKIFIIIFSIVSSLALKAQVTDYCENLKQPISAVQSAACFENFAIQTNGFESIYDLMKIMNPKMADIALSTKDGNITSMGKQAYNGLDHEGSLKGVTRVAIQVQKNVVFIIATLPYNSDNDDFNYAEVVILVLNGGEAQLCTYGKFFKKKLFNNENKFLHKVDLQTNEVVINNLKTKPDISLTFSSNYFLSEIEIGEYNFKIK